MPRVLRIGLVQHSCAESPSENLARAETLVREAAGRGAELVCLQELFRTRYFCQVEDSSNFELAEPIPGPTTSRLAELATSLGVDLVVSLF